MTGFTGDDVIKEGRKRLFKKWLIPLQKFLKKKFGPDYKFTKRTKRSVQFKFKRAIEVDLLVSPVWPDQHKFYEFLKGIHRGRRHWYENCHLQPSQHDYFRFTMSACKWQVKFFKKQPRNIMIIVQARCDY